MIVDAWFIVGGLNIATVVRTYRQGHESRVYCRPTYQTQVA